MSNVGSGGAAPMRVSIGSIIDSYQLVGNTLTANGALLADNAAYKANRVGMPKSAMAFPTGSGVIRMKGRSALELLPLGIGVAGDVGRIHVFGWRPVEGLTGGGSITNDRGQKAIHHNSWLWVRRWLLDFTYNLGARVGVTGVTDGNLYAGAAIAWDTVRFANTITMKMDGTYGSPGARESEPDDFGGTKEDIASVFIDCFGAHTIEVVNSRNDNSPSGSSVPSGSGSINTAAPDVVGCLFARL